MISSAGGQGVMECRNRKSLRSKVVVGGIKGEKNEDHEAGEGGGRCRGS